jgi:hypothetical protein
VTVAVIEVLTVAVNDVERVVLERVSEVLVRLDGADHIAELIVRDRTRRMLENRRGLGMQIGGETWRHYAGGRRS